MSPAAAAAAVFAAAALALAGCSSSGSDAPRGSAAASGSSEVELTDSACPPAGSSDEWPAIAPAELPVPDGLHIVSVQHEPNVVIRFTVAEDFHATVRYLLEELPKSGFTLETGDSEAEEADIPFSHGEEHASLKITDADTCLTEGLLGLGADQD